MAFVGGPLGACRWVVGVGEAVDPAVCATCTKRPTGAQNPRPAAIYMGEGEPQFKIKNRAANNAWEVGYKAYLGRSGEKACLMAMEGYRKLGRGGVFVVDRPNVNVGVGIPGQGGVVDDAVTSMYVALAELEERSSSAELEPIMSRMRLYDPTKQFVCVFEIQTSHGGVQGADIVTPKRMPTPP